MLNCGYLVTIFSLIVFLIHLAGESLPSVQPPPVSPLPHQFQMDIWVHNQAIGKLMQDFSLRKFNLIDLVIRPSVLKDGIQPHAVATNI